jgi:CBS-domain-containing membrane protein
VDDSVSLAEKLMCEKRVRRLPVLDFDDRLAGVISLDDIARQAQQEVRITGLMQVSQSAVAETLAEIAGPTESRRGKKSSSNRAAWLAK